MKRNRTRLIAILAVGIVLAVSPMAMASASQRGSKGKPRHPNSQTANFCGYYSSTVAIYQTDQGEFTHEDPAMQRMVYYLTKMESEAPAALKSDVKGLLKATKAALATKNPNHANLTGRARPISEWSISHCSGNSGQYLFESESSGSSSSGNSGNTGSSTGRTGSLSAFCRDVHTVTGDMATLLLTSKDGGTEVSASLLRKAAAAAQHLANEAPSSVKQDAETAARDLKSPNNPNADIVGDEASLSTDYDTDCPGGVAYSGSSGNTGNSGGTGNSGNTGTGNSGTGNSGNTGVSSSGNS